MTELTWMLYLADVSAGIKALFVALAALATAASCMATMFGFVEGEPRAFWWVRRLLPVAFAAAIAAVVVPGQRTVYLIAGAQAAEAAASTEAGQAILGDVQSIIRAKLDEMSDAD